MGSLMQIGLSRCKHTSFQVGGQLVCQRFLFGEQVGCLARIGPDVDEMAEIRRPDLKPKSLKTVRRGACEPEPALGEVACGAVSPVVHADSQTPRCHGNIIARWGMAAGIIQVIRP